jgi:hypothetical protein
MIRIYTMHCQTTLFFSTLHAVHAELRICSDAGLLPLW